MIARLRRILWPDLSDKFIMTDDIVEEGGPKRDER